MNRVRSIPHKKRYVIYTDHNGIRRNLHCGRVSTSETNSVLRHVKHLVDSRMRGRPCRESTRRWLNDSGGQYVRQLMEVGLVRVAVD